MIEVKSPAKLNLFLEVTGKRPDGYHNIDSIFVTINLYDQIVIELLDNNIIEVTTDNKTIPDGEQNIVYKSIKRLKDLFGIKQGVRVCINKQIPVGAGLGGGSSNAGMVMRALSDVWGFDINDDKLYLAASKIGADVPFFLRGGGLCRCTGIGDIIERIDCLLDMWFVLVNPGIFISTADVYKQTNLTNCQNYPKILLSGMADGCLKVLSNNLFNRLEEAVFKMHPEIGFVKQTLYGCGCLGVCMSGSGSSVFGLVESEKNGYEVIERLRLVNNKWFAKVVKSLAGISR